MKVETSDAISSMSSTFNEVEMESSDKFRSSFLFGSSSALSILITFCVFIFFEFCYIGTAILSPSPFNQTSLYYPIDGSKKTNSTHIFVKFSPFTRFHKYFHLDAQLSRNQESEPKVIRVNYSMNTEMFKGPFLVRCNHTRDVATNALFSKNDIHSNLFEVIRIRINDVESIQSNIDIVGNLNSIKGVTLQYKFADPNYEQYLSCLRAILSANSIFSTAGFVLGLFKGGFSSIKDFGLLFSVSLIMATNPFSFIFEQLQTPFLDTLMLSLYILIFRAYSCILSQPSSTSFTPMSILYYSISCLVFFISFLFQMLCFGDSTHSTLVFTKKNPSTLIDTGFLVSDVLSTCIIIYIIINQARKLSHENLESYAFYGLFLITTTVFGTVAQFLFAFKIFEEKSIPSLVFISIHILCGNVLQFYQHMSSEGYQNIGDDEKNATINPEVRTNDFFVESS